MRPFVAMALVPTGIGCEVGGFAGDATPAVNLLATACDTLLTHPNAVNAAVMYRARPNVAYVEGYALDRLCLGEWALRPVRSNRVALVIDRAVSDDPVAMTRLLNAAHATRAVAGIDLLGWVGTSEPLALELSQGEGGATGGRIANPGVLLEAAREALSRGAEAIALVARMPAVPDEQAYAYAQGRASDPIGGLEAVLSHLVVSTLMVPCAHAPYEPFEEEGSVDPRVAAEAIGLTFLPCILEGLSRAPRYRPISEAGAHDLTFDAVDAVVAPREACGGVPMLMAAERGIPLIAVRSRVSGCHVPPETLGLTVIEASSYLEAAGILLALREGLSLDGLRRPVGAIERMDSPPGTSLQGPALAPAITALQRSPGTCG